MLKTLKNIVREELTKPRDIMVTLPKSIKWGDYAKELAAVKDYSQVMNFKVSFFPNTKIGMKCYIVHDGFIRGWMEIVGLKEKNFDCTTTGKHWEGKFIERSGPFHPIDPEPMKGFQGVRYYKHL